MSDLNRACWFASWCHAAGFKRATRKWLVDALVIQWYMHDADDEGGLQTGA